VSLTKVELMLAQAQAFLIIKLRKEEEKMFITHKLLGSFVVPRKMPLYNELRQ
jgi:hypothetical protein